MSHLGNSIKWSNIEFCEEITQEELIDVMFTHLFSFLFVLFYRYSGYLAGYQMSFDTSKNTLSKSNFAIGYQAGDFTLHTNV